LPLVLPQNIDDLNLQVIETDNTLLALDNTQEIEEGKVRDLVMV
jgi:hypothetical protein